MFIISILAIILKPQFASIFHPKPCGIWIFQRVINKCMCHAHVAPQAIFKSVLKKAIVIGFYTLQISQLEPEKATVNLAKQP